MKTKFWYLCSYSGEIKYAGEFENFDEANDFLEIRGKNISWLFNGLPKIETPIGGEYTTVIGDLVTVEVECDGSACVTGCPEGITVEIVDFISD
jgi:hypothetical protein